MTSGRCEHKRRSRADTTCPSALRTVEQALPPPSTGTPIPSHARGSLQLVFLVMAFSLSAAVRPSVVCISTKPTISRTRHLPPISPGKSHLPFSHPDPRRRFRLPPLLRAMPISRQLFRWQRPTKRVYPSRRTLAPSSLLET